MNTSPTLANSDEHERMVKVEPWSVGWSIIGALLVALTIALWGIAPIHDSDIWWQMSYGRYMLEQQTLIPDHKIFTWSETDDDALYCAWIAEIFLYLLYRLGNLPILFVLRFAALFLFTGLVLAYAGKIGAIRHPLTWLLCVLGIMMSAKSGAAIKPEIFSYIFMTLTVFIWIRIKSTGDKAWWNCYIIPVIMLIWVNSHGGFVVGVMFLTIMVFGERMNTLFSPTQALSSRIEKHLFIALVLSALALFITPYGLHYIPTLAGRLLSSNVDQLKTLSDYASIFTPLGRVLLYVDVLIAACTILIPFIYWSFRERRVDWAILLVNLFFGFFYCRMLRTTYFWAPALCFSVLYMLSRKTIHKPPSQKRRRGVGVVIMIVALVVSGRSIYARTHIHTNYLNYWLGFGIAYTTPVDEAKYIKENLSRFKIGNDYDTGGYLLWELYPKTKIMIDARYFPFKKWYDNYSKAIAGYGLSEFVSSMNCDVWCISHLRAKAIDWFTNSPMWKPVYYGASAVVFLRNDLAFPITGKLGSDNLETIRIPTLSMRILAFAVNINDWDGALKIYQGVIHNFRNTKYSKGAFQFLAGHCAFFQRDYAKAAELMESAREIGVVWNDRILIKSMLLITRDKWLQNKDTDALGAARRTLELTPDQIIAAYNYGVIGWYLSRNNKNASEQSFPAGKQELDWQYQLKHVLNSADQKTAVPQIGFRIVEDMLNGSYADRPRILFPSEPSQKSKDRYEQLEKKINKIGRQ